MRRKRCSAVETPRAVQRFTISPPRQRFTFRITRRTVLSRLSTQLVVASDRASATLTVLKRALSGSAAPSRAPPASPPCPLRTIPPALPPRTRCPAPDPPARSALFPPL